MVPFHSPKFFRALLDIGQKEMNLPIEIEFAVNLNVPEGAPKVFSFLQIRPIVVNDQTLHYMLTDVKEDKTIIFSQAALGNGIFNHIKDIIYVKPGSFDPAKNTEAGTKVEELNTKMKAENLNYVLVGPGRWGSQDPWLGIPIKWTQISEARVIVESGLENYRIDPSQGTHFFQNLTSFGVGYFTINPYIKEGYYDLDFLDAQPAVYEDEFIRHVRFKTPMKIMIDGRTNTGVIFKP